MMEKWQLWNINSDQEVIVHMFLISSHSKSQHKSYLTLSIFCLFSVETRIAFSTRLTENVRINDNPLIFDVVDLNIGDGYNEFTGTLIKDKCASKGKAITFIINTAS